MARLSRLLILVILVSWSSSLAQEATPALSVTPFASFEQFDSHSRLNAGFGLGAALSYAFSPGVVLGLEAHMGNADEEFDVVGGTSTMTVHHATYMLTFDYRFFSSSSLADVYATAGVGMFRLSTDERQISRGALGHVSIPGTAETRGAYSLGLVLSRSVSSRIAIRLEPRVVLLAPLSEHESNYLITGGITFVVL